MRDYPHSGATLRQDAGPQTWSAKAEGAIFALRWPSHHRQRHKLTNCPEIDCVRRLLPPGVIAAAELRANEIDTGADRVLVAENAISDERYVKALALSLGTGYDSLLHIPRAACPGSDRDLIQAIGTGALWLATPHSRVLVIAPHDTATRQLVNVLRLQPDLSQEIWLTTPRHLSDFVSRQTTTTLAEDAISGLRLAQPEFSASPSCSHRTIVPVIGCVTTVAAFACAPAFMTILITVALALVFLGWMILRAMSILTTGLQWHNEI